MSLGNGNNHDKWCEVVVLFIKGPRTVKELREAQGVKHADALYQLVKKLHYHGLVYRKGRRALPDGTRGKGPVEYAWQPSPFEIPDAV